MTGATSPTGRRLILRFLDDGWSIRALVRTRDVAATFLAHPHLHWVEGDLRVPEGWRSALEGSEAVAHVAPISLATPLLRACAEARLSRFVCLSSTRRFSRSPDAVAEAVIAGEAAVEQSGLDYTVLRSTMIYGPAGDRNVERLVEWLRRRRWAPLVAGGAGLVQPVHADDVASAFLAALAHPDGARQRTLTLAGPEPITWRAMVETVGRLLGRPVRWVPLPYPIALAGAAAVDLASGRRWTRRDQVRRLREDKAFSTDETRRALPGWSPRPFERGVAEKLAEMGLLVAPPPRPSNAD